MKEFQPHSEKQQVAVFSRRPVVVCGTGIQWGKTSVGAIKAKMAMHTYTDPSDNFLITAPTYKIMQQSTLPAFLRLMDGCGEFSKADMVYKVHGGGTCYLRTGTDPDSIVGITNVRFIWGDEAGLYTLYFWENIQARAALKEAQIVLTTSPYTLNWLFKEIIRPAQRGSGLDHVELIQAASWENPYMSKAVIDRARQVMDARRFNALFGGQWERMTGLVYDCFDEQENQCESMAMPHGTRFVGGIDWGYTEPFVFKARAITITGQHYGIFEVYKSGLTITDMGTIVLRAVRTYGITQIFAGPDQPGYIEELNRLLHKEGVRCTVLAANNDVRVGVDRHYELIKTRKLKYFRGMNPHTMDEIDTYHYPAPEDLKPDEHAKDQKPVQQNDHAMDAERYISIMTHRVEERRSPVVPSEGPKQEDQFKRLERLKKGPKRQSQTERWS